MRYKKLRAALITFLILIFLCAALVLLVNTLVHNSSVQRYLLAELSKTTGYNHSARILRLNFRNGFGFSALDVVAESQTKPERIEASELSVALDFSELLKGRVVPSRIFVFRPQIEMAIVKGDGPLEVDDDSVFKYMVIAGLSNLRSASIRQGRLIVKGFPFELEQLDFDIYPHRKTADRIQVNMRGEAVSNNDSAHFDLQGTVFAHNGPDSDPVAEMTLKTERFPLTWIPLPKSLLFSKGTGEADISFKGTLGGPVSARGKITAGDVHFSFVRRGQTKDYRFASLQADFISLYSKKILEISSFKLKGPDFSLTASSKMDFKNKSDPHFILKVESPLLPLETFKDIFPTPFVRPWVKEKIFPALSGGKARLVHFSMNGTRYQLKHLRLPENRKVISMKIEWEEIDALRDNGGLPFERVSGDLNIENSALSTSITHAVFGNSTITSASLDVSSLYEAPTYGVSEEGLFDLQDIKQQENLDVMPSGARKFLQRFKNVSGKLEGNSRVSFEKGWANPRVLMGKFHFTDCSTEFNGLHLPLLMNDADIHIDGEGEPQFQGIGSWGGSEFRVSGSTDRSWKVREAQIDSRVHVNGIIGLFLHDTTLPLNQKDLIPIKAALTRKRDAWLIQGETNLDGVALKTDSFSLCPSEKCKKAVFDMEIFPGDKVCLNSLKYKLGESAFDLNGSFDLISEDIIHVNVSSEKLLMEDLGILFGNENAPPGGVLSCRAEARVSLKDPSKTSVTGVMTGRDISLNLGRMASPVKDCHMMLKFSEKDISIRSLSMRMGESLLDIHGDVQGWDGLKGKITVNADFLNVSDFMPKRTGAEDKKSRHGSFWKSSDIQLILNARKGKWKKLTFAPLKAECDFRSGDLYVKTGDAQMAHGTVTATGHVKNEQGPERLLLTSEIKLEKQPFDDLKESLGFKKGVEGLLTLEASLSAKSGEVQGLISGLAGSADILLEEGRIIRKRGIIFNILKFLSLRNMIKWEMPDFSRRGFDFKALEAHVDIKEGNVETNSFIFKSAIFNATAQGNIFLPTETVDFDFWIQTLEALDFVICNVPIIGYILTEKENSPKGVIIYPLEVDGNWSNPNVKSSVLKNLGPGVVNIFKRILLTPGHIFKEISEFTKEIVTINGSQAEKEAQCDNPATAQ
jgi:hypothetical protein